jgi:hypothetical protein
MTESLQYGIIGLICLAVGLASLAGVVVNTNKNRHKEAKFSFFTFVLFALFCLFFSITYMEVKKRELLKQQQEQQQQTDKIDY